MFNQDLVNSLLSINADKKLSPAEIQKMMVEKAGAIIGKTLDLKSIQNPPEKKEKKPKATKSKKDTGKPKNAFVPVPVSERIDGDKVDFLSAVKEGMTKKPKTSKPKASPFDKFVNSLKKLAEVYDGDEKNRFAACIGDSDGKQVWTNKFVIVRLKKNAEALNDKKPSKDIKYPAVKGIIDKLQPNAKDILFELTGKEIKEIIKGIKKDKFIIMEGVPFGVGNLRALAEISNSVKIYKGANNQSPMYLDTEFFDGVIAPAKLEHSIEEEMENGVQVWNKKQ